MKKVLSLFFTILLFSHLHGNSINWSNPPLVLSATNLNSSNPQLAIDPNGNTIAVWAENNVVKSSSHLANGSWSSEISISSTGASSPCVVSDQSGNATAVWVENGVIKAATKPFNSNWSASTNLSTAGASSPVLCVDAAGDVVAAWVRNGNLETSTKLFGANWQSRVTITSSAAATPSIAVGGTGSNRRAVVVWQGVSSGTNVVFTSSRLLTGSWSSAQIISETDHNAAQPFVAVDSNVNAIAVWYAYDITGPSCTNVTVKSAQRFSSTGVWSDVSSLSAPGVRNPASLVARVAFDSIGNAMALWNTSFDDETFTIESAVKPVNGSWSAPVDLANSNLYAYVADLSATSYGDVLGLYMFYNGASLMIQSVESDMNGFLNNFWSVPVTISLGTNNAFPKIVASIHNNAIYAAAIWVHNDGSHNLIVASTGSKTLPLPPTNLSVSQSANSFGVFSDYANTLSWTASADPKAVGYLIFRNGTFLTQVGADVSSFVDENRALNSSVTYSVAAIDSEKTQSTMASVSFP